MPFAHGIEQGHVVGGGREHGDEILESGEVQLADRAGVALLDQEAPTALRAEAAHDVELGLRQTEAVDVFLTHRLRVGEEDLGGRSRLGRCRPGRR